MLGFGLRVERYSRSILIGHRLLADPAFRHDMLVESTHEFFESIHRETTGCIDKIATWIKNKCGRDIRNPQFISGTATRVSRQQNITPALP